MRVSLRDVADASLHDPATAIWEAAGNINEIEIFHHRVLVGLYIKPPRVMKNADGSDFIFHETDKSLEENRYQGKPGLVLKVGPMAFKDDERHDFGGKSLKVGDWVFARAADGMEIFVGAPGASKGITCRIFNDTDILGRVPDPSMVY
jgi:hypothetical protein